MKKVSSIYRFKLFHYLWLSIWPQANTRLWLGTNQCLLGLEWKKADGPWSQSRLSTWKWAHISISTTTTLTSHFFLLLGLLHPWAQAPFTLLFLCFLSYLSLSNILCNLFIVFMAYYVVPLRQFMLHEDRGLVFCVHWCIPNVK